MARGTEIAVPPVVPPVKPTRIDWRRDLPITTAFAWLAAGWKDCWDNPGPSLIYGLVVSAVSIVVVFGLFHFALDFILLPALSGFLVVAPLAATGLYVKSQHLAAGETVGLHDMLFARIRSGNQIVFVGLLLCLLMLLWNRAAVLLYALFFGLLPFPGLASIIPMLLETRTGWALIIVGSLIGGLFASFSFSISVFAIPRLLAQRSDALTAMGRSMAMVWNNLPLMITWGAIVVALFGLSVMTGMLGMIVIFPVLGHATWHAYVAIAEDDHTGTSDTTGATGIVP
jgi:uncharacterized membrane protein